MKRDYKTVGRNGFLSMVNYSATKSSVLSRQFQRYMSFSKICLLKPTPLYFN